MSTTADIPVPQARYSLLHHNRKGCCIFQNRFVVIIILLILVGISMFALYLALIDIYDEALYPRNSAKKEIPKQWIRHAISYNSINASNMSEPKELKYKKSGEVDEFKLVCYYSFPSEKLLKKNSALVLSPRKIDPNLCTHINLAFASIQNHSIHLEPFQLDVAKSIIALKAQNSNLKVLLSVGGAGYTDGFPEMVINHENRKQFIKSIDFYVKEHKFDGVDLDWEFPNELQGKDGKQKVHFTQLLHEIRNEINRQDKHKYILSVAVAAPTWLVDLAYDVSYMNDYVDYVNLMSYDFHFYTKFTPFTGLNAPLYAMPGEQGYFSTLNINYSANYWHYKGMEKRKIIIGLPTYGHSFKLMNVLNHGLNAPVRGNGHLGSNGFVDYSDVCWFLVKNQITPSFEVESKSPYATKYTEWVSYDDQTSLSFKTEYIKSNNFGGAMVLSLNTDDYQGYCKTDGKATQFPLTNRIKTILNDQQL